MFLSDQLLQLGRLANKRNNLSMYDTAGEMLELINKRQDAGEMVARLNTTLKYVIDILSKEGFIYDKLIINQLN